MTALTSSLCRKLPPVDGGRSMVDHTPSMSAVFEAAAHRRRSWILLRRPAARHSNTPGVEHQPEIGVARQDDSHVHTALAAASLERGEQLRIGERNRRSSMDAGFRALPMAEMSVA